MHDHDTPFPLAGDNFQTLASMDNDLELALTILGLMLPDPDDPADGQDDFAADYDIALAAFQQGLGCTGTVGDSLPGQAEEGI